MRIFCDVGSGNERALMYEQNPSRRVVMQHKFPIFNQGQGGSEVAHPRPTEMLRKVFSVVPQVMAYLPFSLLQYVFTRVFLLFRWLRVDRVVYHRVSL